MGNEFSDSSFRGYLEEVRIEIDVPVMTGLNDGPYYEFAITGVPAIMRLMECLTLQPYQAQEAWVERADYHLQISNLLHVFHMRAIPGSQLAQNLTLTPHQVNELYGLCIHIVQHVMKNMVDPYNPILIDAFMIDSIKRYNLVSKYPFDHQLLAQLTIG